MTGSATSKPQAPPTPSRATPPAQPLGGGLRPDISQGGVVPPPALPLTFLAAGGLGLMGFGTAVCLVSADAVAAPTLPRVVGATHLCMLAFLSTGVLGALHQFGPVVSRRRLRSLALGWATAVTFIAGAWLLPFGFAFGPEWVVTAGGVTAGTAVILAAWNLSGPLSAHGWSAPLWGLRLSVTFLVATAAFGVVYAFDRRAFWFPLLPNKVLAHAHLGLLGWLGITYIAVAEKLWPMFLLSHRRTHRLGGGAIACVATGVALLAPGLLFQRRGVALCGGALVGVGIVLHLASLTITVRHRRRGFELLHGFLLASSAFVLAAAVFGCLGGLAPVGPVARSRFVAAEVAALAGWLGLALLGHAHKIVPFITYGSLRSRGIRTNRHGKPLLFGDLFSHQVAAITLVAAALGFACTVTGLASATSSILTVGGACLAIAGVLAVGNLGSGPALVSNSARRAALAGGPQSNGATT